MSCLLSICSIFKNEAHNLEAMLSPLKNKEVEIVAVDTGSVDATKKCALELGARVFDFKWCDDFAQARNFGLQKAQGDWVLWLDADDRISEVTFGQILQFLKRAKVDQAYSLVVENPMDTGEGESFRQIRLFPNHRGIEFQGRVHEELGQSCFENGLNVLPLDFAIVHEGYFKASDRKQKSQRNFEILEKLFLDNPKDPYVLMELGNAWHQKEEKEKAIQLYQKALEFRLEEHSALRSLELLIANAFKDFDLVQAQLWYEKSIAQAPEYLSAYYECAKILFGLGQYSKAEPYFLKVVQAPLLVNQVAESPKSLKVNSASYLALYYWGQKKGEEALELLENAWSLGMGLAVDPWLPLEICYERNDLKTGRIWWGRLQPNEPFGEWQAIAEWVQSKPDFPTTRDYWFQIVEALPRDPENPLLWKQLKILVEKFDNLERTKDALLVRGLDPFKIRAQLEG